MNVTRMSALEIYGNQADIVCECAGKDKDGYFVGVIRRGLGHDGKWILSAGFDLKTKEEVVSYMESLRDDICSTLDCDSICNEWNGFDENYARQQLFNNLKGE